MHQIGPYWQTPLCVLFTKEFFEQPSVFLAERFYSVTVCAEEVDKPRFGRDYVVWDNDGAKLAVPCPSLERRYGITGKGRYRIKREQIRRPLPSILKPRSEGLRQNARHRHVGLSACVCSLGRECAFRRAEAFGVSDRRRYVRVKVFTQHGELSRLLSAVTAADIAVRQQPRRFTTADVQDLAHVLTGQYFRRCHPNLPFCAQDCLYAGSAYRCAQSGIRQSHPSI